MEIECIVITSCNEVECELNDLLETSKSYWRYRNSTHLRYFVDGFRFCKILNLNMSERFHRHIKSVMRNCIDIK